MMNHFLTEKADRLSVFGQLLAVQECAGMYAFDNTTTQMLVYL